MRINLTCLLLVAFTCSGCATILSGTNQEIAIKTTPEGAQCELIRNGSSIASVASTPATTNVKKTKEDILLVCKKDGYLPTEEILNSGSDSKTYANLVFGPWGLITWALDSATGADNSYPEKPAMTLGSAMLAQK